jgi:hypothetical protein
MRLEHVPLLSVQRQLYELPRGPWRFRRYLELMCSGESDLALPLPQLNPMAGPHVAERLDGWLASDADAVAGAAAREAALRLRDEPGDFVSALVIADDVRGGWTNRFTTDAEQRFGSRALLRRGWITVLLWASEPPDVDWLRAEMLATVWRASHLLRHGAPRTLRQMLDQERAAARFAGRTEPRAARDWPAEVDHRLAPHLDSSAWPVCFAALYGDAAARQLGYTPLGLPAQLAALGGPS